MGLGAFGIFSTNVGLKSIVSDHDYYNYSIIVTVLALLASFGALGLDQVFLRLASVKGKTISFDKKLLPTALISALLTSFCSYLYLIHLVEVEVNGVIIFIICFSSVWIMLFYNVTRLASLFVISQLIQNSWKIFFGTMLVVLFFNEGLYYYFFHTLCAFVIIVLVLSLIYLKQKLSFKLENSHTKREIFLFSFHFFLALLAVSFLSQGDRLLVERTFTESEFGDYFYLATYFLFPFSLFQSYIGFKELVYMKSERLNLNKKLKAIFSGSLLFSFFLFFLISLFSKYNYINLDIKDNLPMIVVFLIIGNIKIIYSLFSSVIGARASLKQIKIMNLTFISTSLFVVVIFWGFIETITSLVVMFSILWLIRLIIWGYFSQRHTFNDN